MISDHLRASIYLIHDGILPQNEGRGYVLRRIIRRALRYGYKLGIKTPFLQNSVEEVISSMERNELREHQQLIVNTLKKEQEQFFDTLESGLKFLDNTVMGSTKVVSGDVLFKLYDTYGFPLDIATDIAKERSLGIDLDGYHLCMEEQKNRSRVNSGAKFKSQLDPQLLPSTPTDFVRDAATSPLECELKAVIPAEECCYLVFDKTPFYAESGGQVGDTGIYSIGREQFKIIDTIKQHNQHLHQVTESADQFSIGEKGSLQIDRERRKDIERHHTATHLLHAALREVLGTHVSQKGSLVNESRLRFDFSHTDVITQEQIIAIENSVNQQILKNSPVITQELSYQEAIEKGALAFFDDKYGERVRMLSMGQDKYSIELCGGTHVQALGEIGSLEITEQESVASGVRRIQAIAGRQAFQYKIKQIEQRQNFAETLNCAEK